MTKIDRVFRDLAQLYDFNKEIRKARMRPASAYPRQAGNQAEAVRETSPDNKRAP